MTPTDPRHGTNAGFHAHKRAGQLPCEPCKRAVNEYNREYNAGQRQDDHDVPLTGGRWVTRPNSAGIKDWYPDPVTIADAPAKPTRRYAKPEDVICGTTAGYYRHKRKLEEPACDECRAAKAAAERARVARREGDRAA